MNNLTLNQFSRCNPYFCSNSDGQTIYNVQETSKFWLKETPQKTIENLTPTVQNIAEKPFFNNIEPDTATNAAGTAVLVRIAQHCIEKMSEICARILMKGKEFAPEADVRQFADFIFSATLLTSASGANSFPFIRILAQISDIFSIQC